MDPPTGGTPSSSDEEPSPQANKRRYIREYPRHLDEPILIDKIDFYVKHPHHVLTRFKGFPPNSFRDISEGVVDNVLILPWLESHFRSSIPVDMESTSHIWSQALAATVFSLELQLGVMGDQLKLEIAFSVADIVGRVKRDSRLVTAFRYKVAVKSFHQLVQREAQKAGYILDLVDPYQILINDDMVCLLSFPGGPIVVPFSMILCVLDKIESHFAFLLYNILADESPIYQGGHLMETALWVYGLLERAYNKFGNAAIDLYKSLEPICVGIVLLEEGAGHHSRDALLKTLEGLQEKNPNLLSPAYKLVERFRYLVQTHGEVGIRVVMEMFGQEKMHYYPIIRLGEGLTSMRKACTTVGAIKPMAGYELAGSFVKHYMIGYYEKEGVYPPINMHVGMDPRIKHLIDSNQPPSPRECSRIPNKVWADLSFKNHQIFNYYPDVMDILDDKAIAPEKKHVNQIYVKDVRDEYRLKDPGRLQETRLIIRLLKTLQVDIAALFEECNMLGYIPPDKAIILLKMKERELKLLGRLFSILTFELRMMASSLERNIAASIFPYFNTQSLSDTGPHLRGKLETLTTLSPKENHTWVYLHMDFKNWNYTFRPVMQVDFLARLDQIFGTNNYKWSWRLFFESEIRSASKFEPPESQDYDTCWRNHLGGNQGICQKSWTLMTQVVLMDAALHYDYEYYLIGAGDNQVLAVNVPESPNTDDLITRLKDHIREKFLSLNLELRIEETWHSSTLVAYQRKYYYKGLPLDSGTKHCNKAYAGTSDIDMGLTSQIATATQCGMAMVEATGSPLIGPLFSYIEGFTTFLCHHESSEYQELSTKSLAILSLGTSDLGFLPFCPLTVFTYAGHKDSGTESLAMLAKIWDTQPQWRSFILPLLSFTMGEVTPDSLVQSILEPSSLNIRRPAAPEQFIKKEVEATMRSTEFVKNLQIRELLSLYKPGELQRISQSLLRIQPIHLSILHGILEISPPGQILSALNRFNSISSLIKFTNMNNIRVNAQSFRSRVDQCDRRLIIWLNRLFQHPVTMKGCFFTTVLQSRYDLYATFCTRNDLKICCTFSLRLFLSSLSVGALPNVIYGPFIPSPLEQLRGIKPHPAEDLSYTILVEPASSIPATITELHQTRGPFSLYIGSRTKDPIRNIRLVNIKHVQAGPAIKTLLRLHAWFSQINSDPRIMSLIVEQLLMRVPSLEDYITQLTSGSQYGNIIHRLHMAGEVTGAYQQSRSVLSTWYRITTNRATGLHRGEDDRYLFFQPSFQYILGTLRLSSPKTTTLHFQVNTVCCSYLLPNIQFRVDGPGPLTLGPIPGVATFPEDMKSALLQEVMWKIRLNHLANFKSISPWDAMAALIGFQLTACIRTFNTTGGVPSMPPDMDQSPQSAFNITNIRKIPLKSLLRGMAISVAWADSFGKGQAHWIVDAYFAELGSSDHPGVRVEPFRPLLEAIVTSGKLQELIGIAKCGVSRGELKSEISLLPLLFRACSLVMRDSIKSGIKFPLMIQITNETVPLKHAIWFLNNWGHLTKPELHKLRNMKPLDALHYHIRNNKTIRVVLTQDNGIVYEQTRKALLEGPVPVPSESDLPFTGKMIFLAPNNGVGMWFMHKVMLITRKSNTIWLSQPESPLHPRYSLIESRPIIPIDSSQEHWYLLGRPHSNSSSGHYKLLSLLLDRNWATIHMSLVICLAEGSGSYLSTLLHLSPKAIGVYNSRPEPESFPPSMSGSCIPTDCLCPCGIHERIANWDHIGVDSGDLTEWDAWLVLNHYVQHEQTSIDLLTWDMEKQKGEEANAWVYLYEWVVKWKPKRVIIKFFGSPMPAYIRHSLEAIGSLYTNTLIMKPKNSDPFSTETFLVCDDWNGHPNCTNSSNLQELIIANINAMHAMAPEQVLIDILYGGAWASNLMTCNIRKRPPLMIDGTPAHPFVAFLSTLYHDLVNDMLHVVIRRKAQSRTIHSMTYSKSRGHHAHTGWIHIQWLAGITAMMCRQDPVDSLALNLTPPVLARSLMGLSDLTTGFTDQLSHPTDKRRYWITLGEFLLSSQSTNTMEVLTYIVGIEGMNSILERDQSLQSCITLANYESPLAILYIAWGQGVQSVLEKWPLDIIFHAAILLHRFTSITSWSDIEHIFASLLENKIISLLIPSMQVGRPEHRVIHWFSLAHAPQIVPSWRDGGFGLIYGPSHLHESYKWMVVVDEALLGASAQTNRLVLYLNVSASS